jgi:hypothetical protein
MATIPFAPESHPVTARKAVPRVPLATEQFFDALPFQESSVHQSRSSVTSSAQTGLLMEGLNDMVQR